MANKHISDELLSAFLEGNVSKAEAQLVLQAIKSDAELRETLGIALQLKDEDASQKHKVLTPLTHKRSTNS